MKKVLFAITILIGCLCVFAAQSHAWPTVDDPTTCWQCHQNSSNQSYNFKYGTTWHTNHMNFTCSNCHTSGTGSTPVLTSSCAGTGSCHNTSTPTPPLFGLFPCYWPDNHTNSQPQRYNCETASCHTSCAPAQTFLISGTVTSSGSGLSGVSMALTGTSTGSTTTDVSGNYSFTGLSNGSYTVTPGKTGYTFAPTSIDVIISGADQTGKNFTATATGTTCSAWADVIAKYNAYVAGTATWTDVINCYSQYAAAP